MMSTDQIDFCHSSLVKTTAHIASWPASPNAESEAALAFPLSPTKSRPMPRSTIPNSMDWTTLLSLWFLVRMFANFMSDNMVFRMNVRKEVDVVRGSSGKRVCNNLGACRQRPK